MDVSSQKEQLSKLIDLLWDIMQSNSDLTSQLSSVKDFNNLMTDYLEQYETESVFTFSLHVSQMGLPYEEVLQDVLYIRSLVHEKE